MDPQCPTLSLSLDPGAPHESQLGPVPPRWSVLCSSTRVLCSLKPHPVCCPSSSPVTQLPPCPASPRTRTSTHFCPHFSSVYQTRCPNGQTVESECRPHSWLGRLWGHHPLALAV